MNYIDITDLIEWFSSHHYPSGVQRVSIETILASANLKNVGLAWFDKSQYVWFCADELNLQLIVDSMKLGDYEIFKNNYFIDASVPLKSNGDNLYSIGMNWYIQSCEQFNIFKRLNLNNKIHIYVHDLIPLTQPHLVEDGFGKYWRNYFFNISGIADAFYCSTNVTKRKVSSICSLLQKFPECIVIPFGIDHFNEKPFNGSIHNNSVGDNNYLITVGTLDYRKNQFSLIKPWMNLLKNKDSTFNWKLIFVGRVADERFNKSCLPNSIEIHDSLNDSEVQFLLSNAKGAFFPTLAEGFCFPAFEAMRAGIPTIVTKLDEIAENGGSNFIYLDSLESEEIEKFMNIIIDNGNLNSNYPKNIQNLTWDVFVDKLFTLNR